VAGLLAHPGDIHGFLDLFTLSLSVVVPLVIGVVWAVRTVQRRRSL
jgi:hypothetical protein